VPRTPHGKYPQAGIYHGLVQGTKLNHGRHGPHIEGGTADQFSLDGSHGIFENGSVRKVLHAQTEGDAKENEIRGAGIPMGNKEGSQVDAIENENEGKVRLFGQISS